jgi:hypothetical protein
MATGCYGKARNGTGGSCACTSGKFSDPELYSLGGIINGVLPTDLVVLKATSTSSAGHPVSQAAVTKGAIDGAAHFMFPYNFRDGQDYKVSVLSVPLGTKCEVKNAAGMIKGSKWSLRQNGYFGPSTLTNTLRVVCTGKRIRLGSTATVGRGAKLAWDNEEERRTQGVSEIYEIYAALASKQSELWLWCRRSSHRCMCMTPRATACRPPSTTMYCYVLLCTAMHFCVSFICISF